jgi:hypothetical protein
MSDYDKFLTFYGNGKTQQHGPSNLGSTYVCPTPTIGGPMGTGSGAKAFVQDPKCGVAAGNMGRLAYCARAQVGGGCVDGMTYSATGQLAPTKTAQTGGSGTGSEESEEIPTLTRKCGPRMPHEPWPQPVIQSTPVTGYYFNLSEASVGGRPIHSAHDNVHPNNIAKDMGNMMDSTFSCSQPFWGEKCL